MERYGRKRRAYNEFFAPEWLDETIGRNEDDELKPEEPDEVDDVVYDSTALFERLQADFTNYKRRVEREREENTRNANRELILKLLPVIDDFTRALEKVPDDEADTDWIKGMEFIRQKLEAVLSSEGIEKINAKGREFDPWKHEAVFCDAESGCEGGTVKSVIRDGYRLHGKVIRPAQVVVSN